MTHNSKGGNENEWHFGDGKIGIPQLALLSSLIQMNKP
jgi:hypothetical protein